MEGLQGIFRGLLLLLLIACGNLHGQQDLEEPDWWQAQQQVQKLLHQNGQNIVEMAAARKRSTPRTTQEAMVTLDIFLRAGMSEQAMATLGVLKKLCPNLRNHQVSSIYYAACDHYDAWDVARKTVELFAENISEFSLDNRLLRHFKETGWSDEKIDAWLAKMPAEKIHSG